MAKTAKKVKPPYPREGIGKLERLAYDRAAQDAKTGFQRGLHFDQDAANHILRFFTTYLRHHEGEWAGQPFILQPWEIFILSQIFGWKRQDGTRRFREALVFVPRKNGKSTKAGAVGNYMLFADNEPGAQVYSSATKRDQARIVWDVALAQVKQSPALMKRARLYEGRNSIVVPSLSARFQPLSADATTLDGLNPHANLVDELHAHPTRKVWDVLDTAMAARRQPLTLAISTAGIYAPESIGWLQYKRGVDILKGMLKDDGLFVFIAEADDDDDPHDPATWLKANPNFGISVKPEYMERQALKASQEPSFMNTFLRLHLNKWTETAETWLPAESWLACAWAAEDEDLRGRPCYGGLDLASVTDMAALVLVWPDWVDGWFDVRAWFWCPKTTVMRRSQVDRVPYDAWVRDGWLTATDGNVIDFDVIRRDISKIYDEFDIRSIGFDRWNAHHLVTQLEGDGIEMVAMGQGFATMGAPTKQVEKLVIAGKLAHGSNPILTWHAANTVVQRDAADNIKPDKAAARERIDGMVATVMAVGRAVASADDSPDPSLR